MKRTISGIRGVFGEDLDLKDVLRYCGNFSSLVKSEKCVVGMDTRQSGHMVLETAKAALMRNGIDIFDLGMVPTPVVFREARRYGAGIIATSSHNPIDWNGLKFIVDGRGINEDELSLILEDQDVPKSDIGSEQSAATTYLEEAVNTIGSVNDRPDVVVDLGGGAARYFAPNLLQRLGCRVETINSTIQGCSRSPDPTSDDLEELAAASAEKDMGFAFDLDGDRLVVVKNGRKQAPDVTLGLGIAKSIELGCKKFVLSVDSSVGIEKFVREKGCSVQRTKVGEANVIDMMLKTGAQAGGEGSSGGFVLPEFNYCRDGILTSGLVASMLGDPGFDEVLNYMEKYHQIRKKVRVDSIHHDMVIEKTLEKISGEFSEINTIDGVKGVIDENSWILIRKSNTEDVIRVSGESDSQDRCKKNVKDLIGVVNQCHEQVR